MRRRFNSLLSSATARRALLSVAASATSWVLASRAALAFLPRAKDVSRGSLGDWWQRREAEREAAIEEAERARLYRILGDKDLELEAQLEQLLDGTAAAGAGMTAQRVHALHGVVEELERSRGRQQRAGWGQSDEPYDLPYIGAWDVLYASRPGAYEGRAWLEKAALVSARHWIYGPGVGGAAAECVYGLADGSAASSSTQVLLTRVGSVTKLDGAALELQMSGEGRAYELSFVREDVSLRQRSDGQWEQVETTSRSSKPWVRRQIDSGGGGSCAAASGVLITSYLSDVLWILREPAGGITVLRRSEAEALRPQNGAGPDGFDALRFGPSGRRLWMLDTGLDEAKRLDNERQRQRMRSADEISAS